MGSLFRSEEMCLAQLFLQTGTAFECVSALGERGLVEFIDLNKGVSLFQRRYVGEIRRCEELERTLGFLQDELTRASLKAHLGEGSDLSPLSPRDVLSLQEGSEQLQAEVKEVSRNFRSLQQRVQELRECREVIACTQDVVQPGPMSSPPLHRRHGHTEAQEGPSLAQMLETTLSFVAGTVHPWKVGALERLLWRACRGHVIFRFSELSEEYEDPTTGESVRPVAFVISYWGETIGQKVRKICDCYHCHVFPCPTSKSEYEEMVESLNSRLNDLKIVLSQTEMYLNQVLEKVAQVIQPWTIRIQKMKAIYLMLNQCNFDITGKCLIAEVWCPKKDLPLLKICLEEGSQKSGTSVPSFYNVLPMDNIIPPTLNKTNNFTNAFQGIVDAYGVAKYSEVNPAPFTIITFPFLFAVMFGDVGHGLLMFFFALWMILSERDHRLKHSQNEIWQMFFHGRYLLLMMGLFSVYTGLIYNDCFSMSLTIFPSAWSVRPMLNDTASLRDVPSVNLNPVKSGVVNGVYPFGIDPIWHLAVNKLTFLNSFKMKMSVILGVVHMSFGVVLGMFNYVHFGTWPYLLLVLLPELVFLLVLFGYLVFLIVYKWVMFGAAASRTAPSILIHFIDMFLFTSSPRNEWLYHGQRKVQTALVIIALLCIPTLLLGKPLYLCWRSRRVMRTCQGGYTSLAENEINADVEDLEQDLDDSQVDLGDVFMKQAIHTIEYCLSCISNTASYLRLWALSLAHAQLSEVLWNMVLRQCLRRSDLGYSVLLFAGFAFFAVLTIAILLVMEGLSAFLHALRLHWVEFQTKFYSGTGVEFEPFTLPSLEDSTM